LTRKKAKSADQTSLRTPGTTETPGALRSPPVAYGEPRRLLSSTPFQSSSGECRSKTGRHGGEGRSFGRAPSPSELRGGLASLANADPIRIGRRLRLASVARGGRSSRFPCLIDLELALGRSGGDFCSAVQGCRVGVSSAIASTCLTESVPPSSAKRTTRMVRRPRRTR
jgi:hypothetical protein